MDTLHLKMGALYFILIGLEIIISNYYQLRIVYTWRETVTNFIISILNGLFDLLIRSGYIIVLLILYRYRLTDLQQGIFYWVILFILVDFLLYWMHRLEHQSRFFWAAHVTHHSGEHMNLTVGVRASLMRPLYDFLFFIPLSVIGFRPLDIMLIYSVIQIWAVMQHTEIVRKLGWFEYLIVTPSHHRVHHGSNEKYLDKNMGMVLIIWDKIFGTFQQELKDEEYEPIRYGLTKAVDRKNFVSILFGEWIDIMRDVCKKDIGWYERWKYVFGPPGWQPKRRGKE